MKKLSFGSAAFAVVVASSAFAADIPAPVYKAPPVIAPVAYSWTGCYVGIEGGGAWGRSHHTAPDFGGIDIARPFDLSGGLAGGTLGCNYQFAPQWVVGIEGDWSWTNKRGTGQDVAPFNPAFVQETKESWLATIRGRVGFTPSPDWLIYVTGGGAFAKFDVREFNSAIPALAATDSATLAGWTVGGGVEWRLPFWQHVTAKVEYLYADFGSHRFFNPPITPGNCGCVVADVKTNDHIFRAGLNWHF
jgi:outer membrane immunogenic protein